MPAKDITVWGRLAKFCGVLWTIAYLIFFPILLYFSFFSLMVFDNPRMTNFLGFFIVFMTILIPLSMPLSIYASWRFYNKNQYIKAHLIWLLPFAVCVLTTISNAIVQGLILK